MFMGNHYLHPDAEKIIKKLQAPGQSVSGVIIEYLKKIAEGKE